jgi:hypothetical protein
LSVAVFVAAASMKIPRETTAAKNSSRMSGSFDRQTKSRVEDPDPASDHNKSLLSRICKNKNNKTRQSTRWRLVRSHSGHIVVKPDHDVWIQKYYVSARGQIVPYYHSVHTGVCYLWCPPTGASTILHVNQVDASMPEAVQVVAAQAFDPSDFCEFVMPTDKVVKKKEKNPNKLTSQLLCKIL